MLERALLNLTRQRREDVAYRRLEGILAARLSGERVPESDLKHLLNDEDSLRMLDTTVTYDIFKASTPLAQDHFFSYCHALMQLRRIPKTCEVAGIRARECIGLRLRRYQCERMGMFEHAENRELLRRIVTPADLESLKALYDSDVHPERTSEDDWMEVNP